MKITWLMIFLLTAVSINAREDKKTAAEKARNNPILVKFRTSYKHVYEGIKADVPYYERMRTLMKSKLSKAKTVNSRRTAKDIIGIFDELIVEEQKILDFFEGVSRRVDFEASMKRVVELETRLRSLVTVKRKRSWLTFDEYQAYMKRGWRPKPIGKDGVMPFARELWRPPKEGATR